MWLVEPPGGTAFQSMSAFQSSPGHRKAKPAPTRGFRRKDTELLTASRKAEMAMYPVLRSRVWMESFGISLRNTFFSKAIFSKHTYMSQ